MRAVVMWTVILGFGGSAAAQDAQDPFAADPADAAPAETAPAAMGAAPPAADPFGRPAAADPFAGPAASDPFGGAAAPAPTVPAPAVPAAPAGGAPRPGGLPISGDEKDAAVAAIRDMNPTTAPDLMFAVRSLYDMGRSEEARFYLLKLIELKPAPDVLVSLHRRYGEALFIRLARDPRMGPEAEPFSRAVLDAAYEADRDPERLRKLVSDLASSFPIGRYRAIDQLRRIGHAALPALFGALADPARVQQHPQIRSAIPQLGEYMLEPLLGALETDDPALRVEVIRTLGAFRNRRAAANLAAMSVDPAATREVREAAAAAIVQIVGSRPDRAQVEQFLFNRASDYFDGMLPARADYENRVTLWTWDAAQKTSVPRVYEAADASLMSAAQLAADLYRLTPGNAAYRRLYLLTNLQWTKQSAGLDQPLPLDEGTLGDRAAQLGLDAVEDVLAHAMQTGRPIAATAAAEILGRRGDASLLQSAGGQPRALATALRHANRRLRMAAAVAILNLDPQMPYAGSSYLTEVLAYAIQTVGTRRALVVHPRLEKAQTLVGLLVGAGFEADAATTGQDAFRLAIRHPDYKFALVSDATDHPPAREMIQMFRKDPRTSRLVVGLMGRLETLPAAEEFAQTDPLVLAFPTPVDGEGLAYQSGRLLRLAGDESLSYDERMDHAITALTHLNRLADQPEIYSFYDLHRMLPAIRAALSAPELSAEAAALLGKLGVPESQRALVTMASQHGLPLSTRQVAAQAFAEAVLRRGLLLTRDEILLQYERYNRSEHLDAGTQQVLGSILDTIETPSKAAKAQPDPAGQASAAS